MNIQDPNERTVVEFNPRLHEVRFLDEQGNEAFEPYSVGERASPDIMQRTADDLARLAVGFESGTYPKQAVADTISTSSPQQLSVRMRLLHQALPNELLRVDRNNTDTYLQLGNIAVAVATPIAEEDRLRLLEDRNAEQLQRQLAETEAADKDKINLTAYSHAIVSTGREDREKMLLPLHTSDELLYCRVLVALVDPDLQGGKHTDQEIVEHAWSKMPVSERLLLGNPVETDIWRRPKSKTQLSIGESMQNMLNSVRSQWHGRGLPILMDSEVQDMGLEFTLKQGSYMPENYPDALEVSVPPASKTGRRTIMLHASEEHQPAIEIDQGTLELFQAVLASPPAEITQEEAIRLLDMVMDAAGKRALQNKLDTEELHAANLASAIDLVRDAARSSLRDPAYYAAVDERTGGKFSHHLRNVSGKPGPVFG